MIPLSWQEYVDNETKLLWWIVNRVYEILWKSPTPSEVISETKKRRWRIIDILQ